MSQNKLVSFFFVKANKIKHIFPDNVLTTDVWGCIFVITIKKWQISNLTTQDIQ